MNDLEKLAALIPHWREHNRAHADEFLVWAERARAMEMPEVAATVEQAAAALRGADGDLVTAADRLAAAGGHGHHHGGHEHHTH